MLIMLHTYTKKNQNSIISNVETSMKNIKKRSVNNKQNFIIFIEANLTLLFVISRFEFTIYEKRDQINDVASKSRKKISYISNNHYYETKSALLECNKIYK